MPPSSSPEGDGETENVSPPVEAIGLASVAGVEGFEVLGRHVSETAAEECRRPRAVHLRATAHVEIRQQRLALGGEEHVGGFDVAVQHFALVSIIESGGQLGTDGANRRRPAALAPALASCRIGGW